jgi:hypothetical protein
MIQPSLVWNVWYGTMFGCVAPAHRRLAAREVVGVHVREHRDLHVEQRHVDVLAFARAVAVRERGEHRDGRVQAGHEVGDRHAGLLRAAAGQVVALAGDAHEAAHALDDEVVARALRVRARLAEAGDRAVDQVGLTARSDSSSPYFFNCPTL